MNPTLAIATTILLASAPSSAFAAGLFGSQSTAAVYCCSAPVEAQRISTSATAVVGSAVEFPLGSLASNDTFGAGVIPLSIDVGENSLALNYTSTAFAASGAFNGYRFSFAGAPVITGLTLNPLSNVTPTSFSFTPDSILVNVANLSFTSSSRLLFDVATVPLTDPIDPDPDPNPNPNPNPNPGPISIPDSSSTAIILGLISLVGLSRKRS
jgi:hypothetical protein